jgi:hypothetical protein
LRRMEICDEDLELLAQGCTSLQVFHFLSCNPHRHTHTDSCNIHQCSYSCVRTLMILLPYKTKSLRV